MKFENIPLGMPVKLECVLLVLGSHYLSPYLIEGDDEVVEYFRYTMDNKIAEHAKKLQMKLIRIDDENFLQALQNQLSPLCGNYYSYANKIVIEAVLNKVASEEKSELVLSNIKSADIWDDGNMLCIEL